MDTTTVVVIGAGQAGLAMSRCLTEQSIDHVLLERGAVANSWRTERWDSLRLLTPNWLTRLPGFDYAGEDPDGYMTATEVTAHLAAYQRSIAAPVRTGTSVHEVRVLDDRFEVRTDQGSWRCRAVVDASGAASTPRVPDLAAALPATIDHVVPIDYRNPAQLDPGPVLVVGASASGAQIADELRRSGRDVTLAVGEHVRMPRTYRGMDIHWWLDAIGQLDERWDEVEDLRTARRRPSSQLVGTPERRSLDLNTLTTAGVQLVGRAVAVRGNVLQFSGSLTNFARSADLKQGRLLDRIDEFAAESGLDDEIGPPDRPEPIEVATGSTEVDLGSLRTVVWATGYRPHHPWFDPALLDPKGMPRHEGGVMDQPGMYLLGKVFLRRRKSSFIGGVGDDARDLTEHLVEHLERTAVRAR